MVTVLVSLVVILTMTTIILLVKVYLLHKSAKEIREAFADRLVTDTNTLISISGHDKQMCEMANDINIQLRKLREERHCYTQGDLELKNAVTNMSHDIRTPLTAICGYVELLKKEDKSPEVSRYLDIIEERTDMLKQLTEELFGYSIVVSEEKVKRDKNDSEEVVLNSVLEESVAAFYTALKDKKIVPEISIPEKKVIRKVNRSDIYRVIGNLINNAIKYSDGDLEIVLTEEGEIVFTNTAYDLSEIQVGRLFDRFYTVEAARKSTGLGLAIARTLVERMNGSISANYENDRLSIIVSI